ncbi:unnamed protein product [Victoria cruziana]
MPDDGKRLTKKRKQGPGFIYGNYNRYYGYRVNNKSKEDPRVTVMKREWFEDKDCLDIGCNEGVITIDIAKRFSCRRILGVDIDNSLVTMAWKNLKIVASASGNRQKDKAGLQNFANGSSDGQKRPSVSKRTGLLDKVSFESGNFLEDLCPGEEKYDTILCLSVTKWIHLNWGDDGLIKLFSKIWKLLRPGGMLLLEPQPWKSYERKRRVCEVTSSNFGSIRFSPDLFPDILLDKIGFRTMETISNNLPGTVAGFDRPIYMYTK